MAGKLLFLLLLAGLFVGLISPTFALDKVKLGTSVRMSPVYYLPPLIAEEKGFWKENGLDVEWVPFAGAVPQMHAVAAGATSIGLVSADFPLMAAERGLPVAIVMVYVSSHPWTMWVRTDSPYRHPRDLKGTRVGVSQLGGVTHSYAQLVFKAHGIEKDVRYVGVGGIIQMMAGMEVRIIESITLPLATVAKPRDEGTIRPIASVSDYLPKPWFDNLVFSRKEFGQSKPDVARRLIKAMLQGTDFIQKNPRWSIDKMKSFQGLSETAAKLVYDDLVFSTTGKIERKAVENIRKVFIEYGIVSEKTPPVDELFTNEFIPS